MERVQVKTTTRRLGGSWNVDLAPGGREPVYDPDDVDLFFVVDGDFRFYLIPIEAVGGFRSINLAAYAEYVVADSVFPSIPRLVAVPSEP